MTQACVVWSGVLLGAVSALGSCRPSAADTEASGGPRAHLLHVWDFETGAAGEWTDYKLARPGSLEIVGSPVRSGRFAAQFTLHRDDPIVSDGKRAELQIDDVGKIGSGLDVWYGFSTWLPGGWEHDEQYEVLAQWKGKRDKDLGEASKSPALALRLRRDHWYITNRWDPRPVTPDNSAPEETLWRAPYEVATWTDWVVHARWSYGADGLLEIWKDGVRVVEKHGPNTYNDRRGMYFKIGIYKPRWMKPVRYPSTVERRVVVHDEIRIGGPGATYADVAPG